MERKYFLTGTDTVALYALLALDTYATGGEVWQLVDTTSSENFEMGDMYRCLKRMAQRNLVTQEKRKKLHAKLHARDVSHYRINENGKAALFATRRIHEEMGHIAAHVPPTRPNASPSRTPIDPPNSRRENAVTSSCD